MINSLPTPATYTRILLRLAPPEERNALLCGTGLKEELLSSSAIIRADQQIQVFRNAKRLATSPDWALALGQQLNVNSHGTLGFAVLSAPTLGDSLQTLATYARIRAPYLQFGLERFPDRYHLTIEPVLEIEDLSIAIDEIVLQIIDSLVGVVLGGALPGVTIMLNYHPPEHAADYSRYFSAPCKFEQLFSGLEIPLNLCQMPCPLRDDQGYITCTARCREALSAIIDPADVTSRVRNLLAVHFEKLAIGTKDEETPQLENVASTLCMSTRTLIRQLAAQGCGYRGILEDAQKEAACKLLAQSRYTINEIALLLGYSDGPNFGRAFQRWFGMSPGQYRRR